MSETEFDRRVRQGKDVANDAQNAAGDFSHRLGSAAADAGAAVRDAMGKAYSSASDMGRQAYGRGQKAGSAIADQVESQPMTAVMIAAAAGFFAGLLLARR